ncbi:hypothetical protein ACERZ8_09515 [Tateyamaria armeniaca]|uniref:Phage baseplate protein n=1 Tax=Tateyamaria armeniaca TaxID=2518930 RepID=A0ABW8UT41_9RHOB
MTLREVTATQELEVTDTQALLSQLCMGGPVPQDALNLSEQDMAMAALYTAMYGETIECHVPCSACDRKFETQFELSDWIASLRSGPDITRTGPNTFLYSDFSFRVPMSGDLDALGDVPPKARAKQLAQACVLEGTPDQQELEAALMRAGPMLDDDIEAHCPHCDAHQTFPLRLDAYFWAALRRERPIIIREIHQIAMAYNWPRSEIMSLPRSLRREHVRLILSDHRPRGVSSWR